MCQPQLAPRSPANTYGCPSAPLWIVVWNGSSQVSHRKIHLYCMAVKLSLVSFLYISKSDGLLYLSCIRKCYDSLVFTSVPERWLDCVTYHRCCKPLNWVSMVCPSNYNQSAQNMSRAARRAGSFQDRELHTFHLVKKYKPANRGI